MARRLTITKQEQAVIRAAKRWWKGHRPCEWQEWEHMANPCVNVTRGDYLAVAVSRLLEKPAKKKVRR